MTKTVFSFLLLLIGLPVLAQNSYIIDGRVLLLDGTTLKDANIRLVNIHDGKSMVSTNSNLEGKFSMKAESGSYILSISHIGYTTFESKIHVTKDLQLPDVQLEPASFLLDAVVITRDILPEFNASGFNYAIADNPKLKELPLDQIISLTPGMRTTQQSIEVFGKNIQKVMINGRETQLKGQELITLLQGFSGKQIKNMEVVVTSGVTEDASMSGGSMLKITTTKIDDGGSLSLTGSANRSEITRFYTGIGNLQWRVGKFSIYGMGSIPKGSSTGSNYLSEIQLLNQKSSISTSDFEDSKIPKAFNSTLGLGYSINEKQTLALEGYYRISQNNSLKNSTSIQNFDSPAFETITSTGSLDNQSESATSRLTLSYVHEFDRPGTLTLSADRIENEYQNLQNNFFSSTDGLKDRFKSNNDEHNLIYTTRLDYQTSFGSGTAKQTLRTGAKYTFLDNKNVQDGLFDRGGTIANFQDEFLYTEKIFALYGNHSFSWGPLNLNWGARLENADIFPRSVADIRPEAHKNSWNFYPELGLFLPINKRKRTSISLHYTQGISRPRISALNPSIQQDGQFNFRQGNLFMPSTYPHNLTARFVFNGKYILNSSVRKTNGVLLSKATYDEENQEIITKAMETIDLFGWSNNLEVPFELGELGELRIYGGFALNQTHTITNISHQSTRWNVGANVMLSLPWKIRMIADIDHRSASQGLYQTTNRSPLSANIILNRSFLNNRLHTGITLIDMFSSVGHESSVSNYTEFIQHDKRNYNSYAVNIRASYTMRWGNRILKIKRSSTGGREEESRTSNPL